MPIIGDLKVRITATTKELRSSLARASSLIRDWSLLSTGLTRGITTAFKNVANIGIKAVRTAILGLGAAFTAVSVRGASFQDNLVRTFSILRRSSQATGEDFKKLQAQARNLGRETIFSATKASEGMLILARSGQNTEQVMKSIGPALDLASIGGLDLAESSKIVTQTLSQFGLKAGEAGRVADVLALGSVKANTSVGELGSALSFVGGIAKASGLSLEETTAAILATSNAGIKGTRAGTSLRQTLSKLLSPTGRAGKIFKEYGINVKKSNGELKPLAKILTEIRKASLDAGETLDAFGRRAGPSVLALINASNKITSDFVPALKAAKGTANEMGQELRTTLIGRVKDLGASLDNLGGAFFDKFVDPVTEGIFSLRNFVVSIEEAGKKTGFFEAVVTGVGIAIKPIISLLTNLSSKFLKMFSDITSSDVISFFENMRDRIREFIQSATSGKIKETLVSTFKILNASVSSFVAASKIALSTWRLIPESMQPFIAAIGIATAGVLTLVGGFTNIIFNIIAIAALWTPAAAGFAGFGALLTGTILPAMSAWVASLSVIVAEVLAISAIFVGVLSIGRFLSELKLAGALVSQQVSFWKLLGAQIGLAVAKISLFNKALFRKDTTQAASNVVSAQAGVQEAKISSNTAGQNVADAIKSDLALTKRDFNLTSSDNRVQRTITELNTLLEGSFGGFKKSVEGLNNAISINTSIPKPVTNTISGPELTKDLGVNNLKNTKNKDTGFIDVGGQSLEQFTADINSLGTENIQSVKLSTDGLKQALIKTKEGLSILTSIRTESDASIRAEINEINLLIQRSIAQVKKPADKTIKQSKPSSGL